MYRWGENRILVQATSRRSAEAMDRRLKECRVVNETVVARARNINPGETEHPWTIKIEDLEDRESASSCLRGERGG